MDHSRAPVLDAVADYHRQGRYGFTPPGHRQGRGADPRAREILGAESFRADLLASGGLDDRSSSNGYLSDAEKLMADAVGSDQAFFSTAGSSLSVKAAMLAVAGGRGQLLISRDAHKSIVAGLIFSGVEPRWVDVRYDQRLHLAHPPSPRELDEAWDRHPEAAGALIVSPTPYGTCADIAALAEICHRRGKPLIIDEAWGAHLPFHDDLPTWAMDAGADICVVSVHKMGAGFEQGSVLHSRGDLIDAAHLAQCADLLMTTSPNSIVYAGLDAWRRQMVEHGTQLLSDALALAGDIRARLSKTGGLHVLHDELLHQEASHDLDPLQVLVDVSELGITGYQAADWLRENCLIDVGLSDHRRILATLSMADDSPTADRLLDAAQHLAAAAPNLPRARPVDLPAPSSFEVEPVLTPRDAFFGPTRAIPIAQAAGRVCAEQITPYPPGIPALIPGERISPELIDYLRSGLAAGMVLPDPADPTLDTIRVVDL
ncbi:aminotransferase class I/II-fold pyridoxal phosphate-dependent enzyme [Mangrovihabitans endophyticus]|uniref:Putative Orn/Lys/Arg decarboxylase n=1 Tax=Mangrovihabitans endophyticus TaxID=1751298 RepID=A0A8J3C353_9ACTN|nr:ornithine decarboxylase [Mangrovihabitans endophyticus]GGL11749.1 putative Orn/Lys/Arg decarboxylase [Mangrovihabitans endophyticus]